MGIRRNYAGGVDGAIVTPDIHYLFLGVMFYDVPLKPVETVNVGFEVRLPDLMRY